MSNYQYLPNISSLLPDPLPPDSIVSRTVYKDDQVTAIVFGFAAGQELSEHTASRPAMLHFVSGQARVTFGGDGFEAGPGSWAHMAPQLPHSVFAVTDVVMVLVMVG